MDTIPYTTARAKLASTMDRVNQDQAPLLITRQRGRPAVLMSLQAYEGLAETLYLLSSPANAARLRRGLRDYRAGRARAHKLVRR